MSEQKSKAERKELQARIKAYAEEVDAVGRKHGMTVVARLNVTETGLVPVISFAEWSPPADDNSPEIIKPE